MVRLLATVLAAALLSTSTFAAPTHGVYRRTMPGEVQNPPPMMDDPPAPKPPMMSEPPMPEPPMPEPPMPKPKPPMMDEPPKPPMMYEPPKSTPMMDEPPKSTPMMDKPPKSTPMMDKPPKSTPMMDEPPKSTPMMDKPPPPKSTPMMDKPPPPKSTPMMYEPPKSTPMMDKPPKSTPMMDKPPKSTTPMPEPPKPTPKPSYGSGSNPWSPSYDDCVQKCIAKHGAPTEHTWTPPKEDKKPGAKPTHTVMVAPVDGVPRFLPFALNATVGDTVRFIWTGKNQHSATMSSNLSVCNKSKVADAFDSGLLSGKDGQKTFEVEVKNDQPMWFFCTFGNHCNKGMFGGVNLKSSFGDQKSVGVMMTKWVQSSPDLQAAWTYVQNKTAGTSAEKWGNSISVADIPEDKHMDIAQNILWTRVNLAENPGMQDTGSAQTPDNSPLKLVGDISTLLAETNAPQAAQQQQQPVSASKPPVPSATESKKSGALPSYSSAAVVSVLALLASVLVM